MEEFDSPPIGVDESEESVTPTPLRPVIPPGVKVRRTYTFGELYTSTSNIKWVLQGLLPNKGLMYIGARSGTGKTNLAIQIAADLILGRDTMTLKHGKDLPQQKILIVSLEMGKDEVQERIQVMYPDLSEEDLKLLTEGIDVYCEPEAFKLWLQPDVADLFWLIKSTQSTGILLDSASVSFGATLNNDEQVNETIQNLYKLRQKLNNWMICISHTRKLPAGIVGNMEDVTVDELFGHSGVAQSASSVLLMHHDKKESRGQNGKNKVVWLMNPKSRFAAEFPPFKMFLATEPPILFRRQEPIPLPRLTEEKKREANKVARGVSFTEVMKDIDFGSIGGIEDDG